MATIIDTSAVLADLKVSSSALTFYRDTLKGWHKQAGSKPTEAMLYVPHLLGKRPGVEALHIAMTLRAEGCTVAQFCLAGSCGPANNYRRALVKSGWFTSTVEGKPYAFKLALTAKGADRLAKAQAQLDAAATVQAVAPVKAKASKKAKAKKAKPVTVTAAQNAVTEAAPVTELKVTEQVTEQAISDLAAHFNA